MPFALTPSERESRLETEHVDADGLSATVSTLAKICREKAEHLRTNWQDETAARLWDKDADVLESITSRLYN
jgi:hypothetical protein